MHEALDRGNTQSVGEYTENKRLEDSVNESKISFSITGEGKVLVSKMYVLSDRPAFFFCLILFVFGRGSKSPRDSIVGNIIYCLP